MYFRTTSTLTLTSLHGGPPVRDPNRIDRVLTKLRRAWEKDPDARLGQLIMNHCPIGTTDPYFVEDETLEESFDRD